MLIPADESRGGDARAMTTDVQTTRRIAATGVVATMRGLLRELGSFGVVGGVGFVVDGGLLTCLVEYGAWGPIAARSISFPAAVLVTWLLNRRFTFRHAVDADAAPAREYARYFAVQAAGAFVNIFVFASLVATLPALGQTPILPFGIASALALVVNFLGARMLVFSRRHDTTSATAQQGPQ